MIDYCQGRCENDGWEVQSGTLSKRNELQYGRFSNRNKRGFLHYRSKTGYEIASLEENEIGDKFWRDLMNHEDVPEGVPVEIDEDGNVLEFLDEIAEQIDAPTIVAPDNSTSSCLPAF